MSIEILNDVTVELVQNVGTDMSIINAARVSLNSERRAFDAEQETGDAELIAYLIKNKHGSPLEHNSITFYVEAPIFVFREWHRHRIQSYNEMSGRYTELPPRFYAPAADRPLINIGTSAKPTMASANEDVIFAVNEEIIDSYEASWASYKRLLSLGIAKEIARLVLPVGIMSRMYATANLRAWLGFLSLRTEYETAAHHSRPQYEIALAAQKVETILQGLFPLALTAYQENGRVAP